MSNAPPSFADFFKQATGFSPYPYQDRLANGQAMPQLLNVPTGVGKTAAAILSWVYRRRYHAHETPRRLVYCLPMRTLVEQTYEAAAQWLDKLDLEGIGNDHFCVNLLMGGMDDGNWYEYPEQNAILIGTQDMLLSRALNRGYGMSRYRWPVQYALLNNDCQWVLDETQLMGVGLFTSAQLDLFGQIWPREKPCHFLWMSATIRSTFLNTTDRQEQGLEPGDPLVLERDDFHDKRLRNRLRAVKKIDILSKAPSAKRILAEHQEGRITLVILNTVPAARSMHADLKSRISEDARFQESPPQLCLLHGRFRRKDRQPHISEINEFLSRLNSDTGAVPKSQGLIIVSTQVIEAGFDLTSVRLWAELAPWTSIVQRLGRLNRAGKQPDSCAFFWAPKADTGRENHKDSPNAKRVGPYDKQAIGLAKQLIDELIERQSSGDLFRDSLDAVCRLPEAQDALDVAVDTVIRPNDFFELFATEPDLAGGFTDISHFVRSTDRNSDVQVFWRVYPASESLREDIDLPERDELCSVPFYDVQRLVGNRSVAFEWNAEAGIWESRRQMEIRPGMTLLLDHSAGGYSDAIGWTGNRHDRPTINEAELDKPESIESDLESLGSDWVKLSDHLDDVQTEAAELINALDLGNAKASSIRMAAQWHDWGKSLERWQAEVLKTTTKVKDNINQLLNNSSQSRFHEHIRGWQQRFDPPQKEDELWAKFPDVRQIVNCTSLSDDEKRELTKHLRAPFRPGHRHEAASALAAWHRWHSGNSELTALAVYLIACHHGKVRTVMRRTSRNANVFGLTESDTLKPVAGISDNEYTLNFDCCRFGASGSWDYDKQTFEMTSPSWLQLIDELLGSDATPCEREFEVIPDTEPRSVGPLVLAYLECIICVADIRASKRPGKGAE